MACNSVAIMGLSHMSALSLQLHSSNKATDFSLNTSIVITHHAAEQVPLVALTCVYNIVMKTIIYLINNIYYSNYTDSIVRLLVATLHVGMTGKQDGGYTQLA